MAPAGYDSVPTGIWPHGVGLKLHVWDISYIKTYTNPITVMCNKKTSFEPKIEPNYRSVICRYIRVVHEESGNSQIWEAPIVFGGLDWLSDWWDGDFGQAPRLSEIQPFALDESCGGVTVPQWWFSGTWASPRVSFLSSMGSWIWSNLLFFGLTHAFRLFKHVLRQTCSLVSTNMQNAELYEATCPPNPTYRSARSANIASLQKSRLFGRFTVLVF